MAPLALSLRPELEGAWGRLRVRFDAPYFHRHDKLNGRRFLKGAEAEFTDDQDRAEMGLPFVFSG
jgi:hypothetical protein